MFFIYRSDIIIFLSLWFDLLVIKNGWLLQHYQILLINRPMYVVCRFLSWSMQSNSGGSSLYYLGTRPHGERGSSREIEGERENIYLPRTQIQCCRTILDNVGGLPKKQSLINAGRPADVFFLKINFFFINLFTFKVRKAKAPVPNMRLNHYILQIFIRLFHFSFVFVFAVTTYSCNNTMRPNKASRTFLTVTWKTIIRFWYFLVKIFLTTCHQITVQFPTLSNVCFCIT